MAVGPLHDSLVLHRGCKKCFIVVGVTKMDLQIDVTELVFISGHGVTSTRESDTRVTCSALFILMAKLLLICFVISMGK